MSKEQPRRYMRRWQPGTAEYVHCHDWRGLEVPQGTAAPVVTVDCAGCPKGNGCRLLAADLGPIVALNLATEGPCQKRQQLFDCAGQVPVLAPRPKVLCVACYQAPCWPGRTAAEPCCPLTTGPHSRHVVLPPVLARPKPAALLARLLTDGGLPEPEAIRAAAALLEQGKTSFLTLAKTLQEPGQPDEERQQAAAALQTMAGECSLLSAHLGKLLAHLTSPRIIVPHGPAGEPVAGQAERLTPAAVQKAAERLQGFPMNKRDMAGERGLDAMQREMRARRWTLGKLEGQQFRELLLVALEAMGAVKEGQG